MADFDELWLRLGLVIHEAPKEALHDVLDNAILSKHTDLAWASFEDKLKVSLVRDEKHLQRFLLAYELPTVFPTSGCPGTYETFDVGIVCKLIQYFVGVAVWDSETASLPCKVMPGSKKPVIDLENLQTSHLITASRLALAKVMGVYRNMVFHHTGSPHLSTDGFNHHWENVMVTLQGLGYDVKKVSVYQSGPLDYKSRLLVGTIKDLFKEVLSSIREELASNYDIIDLRQCILNGLKFIGCWVRKLESDMLAELEDLLVKIKALQTNVAGRKEIDDLQETFEKEIADIEGRMHVMELEISAQKGKMVKVEDKVIDIDKKVDACSLRQEGKMVKVEDKLIDIDKKVDACSLRQEENVLKIEMGLNDVRQKVDACIRNRNMAKSNLQERKQRAQEACKSVHESLLKLRELDIFGDPMEGVQKSDLMVSLTTVECRDLDSSRLELASDIQRFPTGSFASLKTVAVQDLFKTAEVVLLRGHPGAGKSTLCHFFLEAWKDGGLWSGQYDFVFYVNAPRLVTLFKEQPFDTPRVLAALYPDVFKELNYEELREFKCLIMVDAIDECNIERVCAPEQKGSFEEAINHIITSSETTFRRIILGRPSACDAVRRNLLQDIAFEFVEVLGFNLEQAKEYVYKFSLHNKSKSENLWQRISDNNTLLQMAHLPIFANVICNVLNENAKLEIKTETELYVWSYFVLLTRHRIRQHGDKLKPSTFEEFFQEERAIDELVKVSEMAFKNLRKGEIFFSSRDFDLAGIGTTFVSPFIVRYERYLSFSHLTQMDFFAAVYLFVTCANLNIEIVETKHLQRVVVMLFGLLGGAVRNSDSAQIVRYFVQPLMKRFQKKHLENHPLTGDIGQSLFRMDGYHQIYLHSCFEFQNSRLLRDCRLTDWVYRPICCLILSNLQHSYLSFVVQQHHQLDHISFFMEHGFVEERRLVRIVIDPSDHRFSEADCSKLRSLIELRARNIRILSLARFAISEEKMEILAPALVFVPNVWLFRNQISEESWKDFLLAVRNSDRNQTRRIERIYDFSRIIPAAVSDELRRLDVECL